MKIYVQIFTDQLSQLEENLKKYFTATNEDISWVENPFMVIAKPDDFSNSEYENLIEITSDCNINYSFNTMNLTDFLVQSYC